MATVHLMTKWAERDDRLFITVDIIDAKDVEVHFEEKKITLVAKEGVVKQGGAPTKDLKEEINLHEAIDPEASTFKVLGLTVQICAIKKNGGYWNKLTAEPVKQTKNWLSVDWNLWKDEDDEEEKGGAANDFGGYGDLSSMLGGGMGGMPGMGGMGGMPGMPDMSALAGMGGMGGMDGMGEGDSDDEDDEGAEYDPEHEHAHDHAHAHAHGGHEHEDALKDLDN